MIHSITILAPRVLDEDFDAEAPMKFELQTTLDKSQTLELIRIGIDSLQQKVLTEPLVAPTKYLVNTIELQVDMETDRLTIDSTLGDSRITIGMLMQVLEELE